LKYQFEAFFKLIKDIILFMKKALRNVILGSLLTGATSLGGLGIFYSQRADAANEIVEQEKHVLIASIGYMGGKPAGFPWIFAARRWNHREDPNTVFITFNTAEGCQTAKNTLEATYRDEMFNSACIVMPTSGQILQSKQVASGFL
tara:strand:+ start:374 stop:811 length:438 start_codon:yes stop_codon:yes gene_type:complete